MKKRYIYFLVGALLCGFIIVAFQISRAAVAYPNPGHELSCHYVNAAGSAVFSVGCDYGTLTGGGCYCGFVAVHRSNPWTAMGEPGYWSCYCASGAEGTAYARCCEVGE